MQGTVKRGHLMAKTSLGTASTKPSTPVSPIINSKAQRFEGVASQSVTSGTVGTSGWDKIRSWVKAICLACIIACCFVVAVDLMTEALRLPRQRRIRHNNSREGKEATRIVR